MQRDDEIYFEQRAREELELAEQAATVEASEAHGKLADLYLERAHPDRADCELLDRDGEADGD